jgi:hypothetical protein
MHSWSEKDEPLRLHELIKDKTDPDPKALACYGMLEASRGRMRLRFVSGRPVSQVTIDFLEWLCVQVQAEGKGVLVLIWDNASQAGSVSRSEPGSANTIRPFCKMLKRGNRGYALFRVGCPPRVRGSIASSRSGFMASEPLSSQLGF